MTELYLIRPDGAVMRPDYKRWQGIFDAILFEGARFKVKRVTAHTIWLEAA